MPPWHVIGTAFGSAARRGKEPTPPGAFADAPSGYPLPARHPTRAASAGAHLISRAVSSLGGTAVPAPAVRQRARTSARDGQENDAGYPRRPSLHRAPRSTYA